MNVFTAVYWIHIIRGTQIQLVHNIDVWSCISGVGIGVATVYIYGWLSYTTSGIIIALVQWASNDEVVNPGRDQLNKENVVFPVAVRA